MHQSFDYDTISTIKNLDEINLTHQAITQVGHTCHQRQESHSPSLDGKCNTLESLLVIFIGVVGFFLLRSFLWYQ